MDWELERVVNKVHLTWDPCFYFWCWRN